MRKSVTRSFRFNWLSAYALRFVGFKGNSGEGYLEDHIPSTDKHLGDEGRRGERYGFNDRRFPTPKRRQLHATDVRGRFLLTEGVWRKLRQRLWTGLRWGCEGN